jgi:hypothetical protein
VNPAKPVGLRGAEASPGVSHRMVLGVLTGIGLIFALPFVAIASAQAPARLTTLVALHYAIVVWSGARIAMLVVSGRPRILTLFFWIYVYLWLGLAPFAQLSAGALPLPHTFSDGTLTEASVLIWLGILGFELGQVWQAGRTKPKLSSRLFQRDLSWRTLVALTVFSLILTPILVSQVGGFATLFTSRQAYDAASSVLQSNPNDHSTAGIYSALLSIPPLIGLLAWFHLRRKPQHHHRPLTLAALLGALLLVNTVVNNPISQSRSWFAVCAFSVVLATSWGSSRRWFPIVAVSLITLTIVVFPFAGYFRYTGQAPAISWQVVANQYATSGDYDSYAQISAGIDYTNIYGFTPGQVLVGPTLFWLPRSLWPGKPGDTGVLLATFEGYAYTNLSAPLWIEMYMAGGYPLTFIAFALLGLAWRRLDDLFVRSTPLEGGVVRIVVPLLAVYEVVLLRGSLLTITGRLVLLAIVPFLLATHRAYADVAARRRGYVDRTRAVGDRH